MAFVVFPLGLGLGAVASKVVGAVFTAEWALVAPMLTVLSVYAVISPPAWTFRALYIAQGRTGFVMIAGMVRLALMLGAITTVGRLGPLWACAAVDFAFVALTLDSTAPGEQSCCLSGNACSDLTPDA